MSIEEEELALEQRLRGKRPRTRRKATFDWSQPNAHVKYAERLQAQQARRIQKVSNPRLGLSGQRYIYVYGIIPEGKKAGETVVLGPYNSQADADTVAETLDASETKSMDTRDLHKATRIWKAELLDRYAHRQPHGLRPSEAVGRKGHKLPGDSGGRLHLGR